MRRGLAFREEGAGAVVKRPALEACRQEMQMYGDLDGSDGVGAGRI